MLLLLGELVDKQVYSRVSDGSNLGSSYVVHLLSVLLSVYTHVADSTTNAIFVSFVKSFRIDLVYFNCKVISKIDHLSVNVIVNLAISFTREWRIITKLKAANSNSMISNYLKHLKFKVILKWSRPM